jgi:hypothetical protein
LMLDYWKRNPMPSEGYVLERMGQEVKNFLTNFRSRTSESAMSKNEPDVPSTPGEAADVPSFEKHRWLYDRLSLARLLAQAGFREVEVCSHDSSRIPDYASYRLDTLEDGSIRKPDSFFMEGTK